jgi:carbonic anhydrase/acetyltransferase-like protein (isoleucine patch superfamily)
MKKIITLFLFSIFFAVSTLPVSAKILTNKDGDITLDKKEIVNDDLLIGAKNVVIDGVVNGDVFIGAETVTITGKINGNLHLGSGSVILQGAQITGNAYIGSGHVSVNKSLLSGSLFVGSGNISLDQDTTIKGSFFVGAGDITIDSQIGRNVYLGAGLASINDNTKVGMNLYYVYDSTSNNIKISDKAVVSGEVVKKVFEKQAKLDTKTIRAGIWSVKSAVAIFSFISTFIIGLLYLRFFKKHLIESSLIVSNKFWKSVGVGLLIILTLIPASLLLLITVIGIPLIKIVVLLIMLFVYLSRFIVSLSLGQWMATHFKWNKKMSNYWLFVIGLVVISVLKVVPVFGFLVSFSVATIGLGALSMRLFQQNR